MIDRQMTDRQIEIDNLLLGQKYRNTICYPIIKMTKNTMQKSATKIRDTKSIQHTHTHTHTEKKKKNSWGHYYIANTQ